MRNITPYIASALLFMNGILYPADITKVKRAESYARTGLPEKYVLHEEVIDSRAVSLPIRDTAKDVQDQLEITIRALLREGGGFVLARKLLLAGTSSTYLILTYVDGIPKENKSLDGSIDYASATLIIDGKEQKPQNIDLSNPEDLRVHQSNFDINLERAVGKIPK